MHHSMVNNHLIKKEKSVIVKRLFNDIAPVYDLLNNIISFGLHKKWKKVAVNQLKLKSGDRVLDLCCGSGDITLLMLDKKLSEMDFYAVDFSEKMINIAQKRLPQNSNVTLLESDAMNLPFDEAYFDHIIISFGLRNLENIPMAMLEMSRVLKKGGNIVNIDFGKPSNPVIKMIYNIYFGSIVPMFGKFFNKEAEYTYLPDSIKTFPSPCELTELFKENGFSISTNINLFMGFVAVQNSYK